MYTCKHIAVTHSKFCFTLCIVIVNCNDGTVRLLNSESDSEGRVEVCIHDAWTTIGISKWDYNDARVVCRELGYDDRCKDKHVILKIFSN